MQWAVDGFWKMNGSESAKSRLDHEALAHELVEKVRKHIIFCAISYQKRSFYQDRLGTNIGEALKKDAFSEGWNA